MKYAFAKVISLVLLLPASYLVGAAAAQNSTIWTGSEVVVGDSGEILTNNHVVDECIEISVQLPTSKSKETAGLVARDKENDLSIIRMKSSSPSVAAFRGGIPLRIGDRVIALGYPLSGLLASTVNLSVGVVSALAGLGDDSRYFQISAPVQPGNSGGPLLDASGHLAGIVSAKLDAIRAMREWGDIPQNINFAIKADVAKAFLESRGLRYRTARSDQQLGTADVADVAKLFTAYIECRRVSQVVTTPPPVPTPGPPKRPTLLESSFPGRWAIETPLNCSLPSKSYSLKVDEGNVIWRDGTGKIDIESVLFSAESELRTITVRSIHPNGRGEKPGTTWTYSSLGRDRILVKPGGKDAFRLARCPS
jgi:hypothetical protein